MEEALDLSSDRLQNNNNNEVQGEKRKLRNGTLMITVPSCTDNNVTLFTGYVVYDLLHFYLHHGSPKEGSHLYYMKRYHNQHHFTHYETGKMHAEGHNTLV